MRRRPFDPSWTSDRVAWAFRVLRSTPMAEDAIEGGWIVGLFDFVRQHQREPSADELPRVMDQSRQVARELAKLAEAGGLAATLAAAHQAKAAKLAQIIRGTEAA